MNLYIHKDDLPVHVNILGVEVKNISGYNVQEMPVMGHHQ